jgi:hypothetical protein
MLSFVWYGGCASYELLILDLPLESSIQTDCDCVSQKKVRADTEGSSPDILINIQVQRSTQDIFSFPIPNSSVRSDE